MMDQFVFERCYELIFMIFQINFGQVPNFFSDHGCLHNPFHISLLAIRKYLARVSASWKFNLDSSIPRDVKITNTMHSADFSPQ